MYICLLVHSTVWGNTPWKQIKYISISPVVGHVCPDGKKLIEKSHVWPREIVWSALCSSHMIFSFTRVCESSGMVWDPEPPSFRQPYSEVKCIIWNRGLNSGMQAPYWALLANSCHLMTKQDKVMCTLCNVEL